MLNVVEQVHAVMVRSTFRRHHGKNTACSVGPLLEAEMSKKCMRCGVKHISKANVKSTPCSDTFGVEAQLCVTGTMDSAPCQI